MVVNPVLHVQYAQIARCPGFAYKLEICWIIELLVSAHSNSSGNDEPKRHGHPRKRNG
jgi:hypothetical protein